VMKLHRLRWLGHVLRMSEHRLPRRSMMTSIGVGWKRVRGGQTKTWHQSLKSLTSGLSHIGRCRLPGWGPRDCRTQWLETLGDMAQNRSQWHRCIHSLSSLVDLVTAAGAMSIDEKGCELSREDTLKNDSGVQTGHRDHSIILLDHWHMMAWRICMCHPT
ncbi:Endonuclease-reverse transcriptase, partial [Schistosoma japonicum]